jgi:hypothetical protein
MLIFVLILKFETIWILNSDKTIIMDIQAQKAIIIEQFKQINDVNLISAIKSLLDYASRNESQLYDIPEAHQKLVMERFEEVRRNPEKLLDWDEAKKSLSVE